MQFLQTIQIAIIMCFTIYLNTTREAIEKRFEADSSVLYGNNQKM